MEEVVEVLNKVVGSSGWCEVGPECAACGGCSLALLFPVDPQASFRFSESKKNYRSKGGNTMDKQSIEGWGVIHTYTREQAIADGQLIDVSETHEAREAGYKVPVCLTVGVHALVQVPESLGGQQDYSGRLWDTLFLAAVAFKRAEDKTLVPFEVVYQTDSRRRSTVALWLCFSEYEGFTIMLPEEY